MHISSLVPALFLRAHLPTNIGLKLHMSTFLDEFGTFYIIACAFVHLLWWQLRVMSEESSLHVVFSASSLLGLIGESGVGCVNTLKTYQVLS
jgi:hypothetical protein